MRTASLLGAVLFLSACGTLENKAVLINAGDTKDQVLKAMGPPAERQMQGENEAWQYCQTGAGFGYHDHRIVWFYQGHVTGITPYKSHQPASSCVSGIQPVDWSARP